MRYQLIVSLIRTDVLVSMEGESYVVDDCDYITCFVAARNSQQLHDGGICARSDRGCDYCCSGSSDSGSKIVTRHASLTRTKEESELPD